MIYYVEDDDNIRELVVYTLTQMNLPCRGFADGPSFRAAMAEEVPALWSAFLYYLSLLSSKSAL